MAPVSIFDSTVHLLHGALHANGFGHLLRINGLEGGSQHVTGAIMFPAMHVISQQHPSLVVRRCCQLSHDQ